MVFIDTFYFICSRTYQYCSWRTRVWENFIDRARFIANPTYLSVIKKYLFYIDQKKALLRSKNIDKVVLEILNQNILEYGIKVILQRKSMLESLQEPFQTMHKNMTEGKEITTLRFKGLGEVDNEKLRSHFEEKIEKKKNAGRRNPTDER